MKIAVVGANGNLGSRVTRQALDRGFQVKGFIYDGESPDERAEIVKKSLFDMERSDLEDCDVMISAYGSGFKADPVLNRDAYVKYIELNQGTDRHVVAIAGAGSLYKDETHTMYCYEDPDYPEFMRGISMNIKFGIDEIEKAENLNWTAVCPSSFFDPEGPLTGNYEISTEGHLIYNEAGESRVTYEDLACAMLDIAEQNTYQRKKITVCTKQEKKDV